MTYYLDFESFLEVFVRFSVCKLQMHKGEMMIWNIVILKVQKIYANKNLWFSITCAVVDESIQ